MRHFLAVLVMASLLFGCQSKNESADESKTQSPPNDSSAGKNILGIYEGILPCADCSGIKMELTLYRDFSKSSDDTFNLKETYLGTKDGDRTFESTGKWTTLRGNKKNINATIYQLNPDKSEEMRNFVVVNETLLKLLDKEMNEVESKHNYTLTKK